MATPTGRLPNFDAAAAGAKEMAHGAKLIGLELENCAKNLDLGGWTRIEKRLDAISGSIEALRGDVAILKNDIATLKNDVRTIRIELANVRAESRAE